MAYGFRRTITLGLASTSDQTDFPVAIKFDSSNVGTTFKTVANGGNIHNTVTQSGGCAVTMPADLKFTSDSAGLTLIPWDVKSYSASTGILWVWVKITTLSNTTHNIIYVHYGDSSVTTQQNTGSLSPANVWNSDHKLVLHTASNVAAGLKDSTSNANDGTVSGSVSSATGQLGAGVTFSSSGNNCVTLANSSSLQISGGKLSICFWIKQTSRNTNSGLIMQKRAASAANPAEYDFWLTSSGNVMFEHYNNATSGFIANLSSSVLSLNTWYHVAIVVDESAVNKVTFYINGAFDVQRTYTDNMVSSTSPLQIGNFGAFNSGIYQLNGTIEEIELSNVVRLGQWFTTIYLNQSDPLSFNTIGSESALGGVKTVNITSHLVSGGVHVS